MNDSSSEYFTFPDHSGIQKKIITQGTGEYPPDNFEVEGKLNSKISSLYWKTR